MEPPHIRGETPRDHNGIPYNNVILYGSGRKEKRLCCGKVTSLTAVFTPTHSENPARTSGQTTVYRGRPLRKAVMFLH